MREVGGSKSNGWLSFAAAVVAALVATGCSTAAAQETPPTDKPNFVFVLTDDQSVATLPYMPAVRENLATRGTTFENFVLTLPTCCPSRATFLRGQYAHNHGISGAAGADGQEFADSGLDGSTVATWLDGAGYETALFGKYLNGYRQSEYVPPGWDRWHANSNRAVWANCFGVDGEERCYDTRNPDPLLARKAERFVRTSAAGSNPFFLWLSFGAPHQYENGPPLFQRQDADEFRDVPLPRPPSFDEADVSDKPPWLSAAPGLTDEQVRAMTTEHRGRLRSLQTVDRAVRNIVEVLAEAGELDNTYIVFTTDNGYHMGEHRLEAGKYMPYKEDANFPLIVRGTGVAEDLKRDELVLNTDFAPTMADLAGASTPQFVDGRSFVPLLETGDVPWRNAALVEGFSLPKYLRPAFSGVWTGEGAWYVEYEGGERELYDRQADPYQLDNLAGTRPGTEAALSKRLESLKTCARNSCRVAEDGPRP